MFVVKDQTQRKDNDKLVDQLVTDKNQKGNKMGHYYDDIVKNGGMLVTGSNFKSKTQGKKGILIVYAEWCGHCQMFHSDVVSLAKTISALNRAQSSNQSWIAVMDSDNQKENQFFMGKDVLGVNGYPAVYFFRKDGSFKEYNGNRTAKQIIDAFQDF